MKNLEIIHHDLNDISKKSFENAIALCYRDGITSKAPLGFSGDTIMLFGHDDLEKPGRVSHVSVRNYCGDAELLITDKKGNFLFYGRFRMDDLDFVVDQYWRIFQKVKHKIESVVDRIDFKGAFSESDHVEYSIGFDMLKAFAEAKK